MRSLVYGLAIIAAVALSSWASAASTAEKDGELFLATKASEANHYKLPSGMIISIKKKGAGRRSPKPDDECDVHYTGMLPDGTKFDSSYDRGAPASFKPSQVIRGWNEALQLMREGDIWIVYIPHGLAYGPQGAGGGKIPGYTPLVFEMELVKLKGKGRSTAETDRELEKKLGKLYSELKSLPSADKKKKK